jgi:hypothetical protein
VKHVTFALADHACTRKFCELMLATIISIFRASSFSFFRIRREVVRRRGLTVDADMAERATHPE